LYIFLKFTMAALLYLFVTIPLRAEDFDLSIEAITSVDPDRSSSLISWVTYLLVSLLFITIGAVFISDSHNNKNKVTELFLPVYFRRFGFLTKKFIFNIKKTQDLFPINRQLEHHKGGAIVAPEPKEAPTSAHLRDLSIERATIVLPTPVQKGQLIGIDFGTLPGFREMSVIQAEETRVSGSQKDFTIMGEVKNCSLAYGDNSTYMVGIKFLGLEKNTRLLLEQYVNQLKLGGRIQALDVTSLPTKSASPKYYPSNKLTHIEGENPLREGSVS
jgi:hypothetical protein